MAPWAHLVLLVHLLGFQQHLGIANGLVGPSHELRKGIGGTSVTSTGNGLVYRGKDRILTDPPHWCQSHLATQMVTSLDWSLYEGMIINKYIKLTMYKVLLKIYYVHVSQYKMNRLIFGGEGLSLFRFLVGFRECKSFCPCLRNLIQLFLSKIGHDDVLRN